MQQGFQVRQAADLPGVSVMRWENARPAITQMHHIAYMFHAVTAVEARYDWRTGAKQVDSGPGAFQVQTPGDSHKLLSYPGAATSTALVVEADVMQRFAEESGLRGTVRFPRIQWDEAELLALVEDVRRVVSAPSSRIERSSALVMFLSAALRRAETPAPATLPGAYARAVT
jgi:hypothetical protein